MTKQKRDHLRLLTSTAIDRTIEKEVRILVTKFASKQMERLPKYLLDSTLEWIEAIGKDGVQKTRVNSGYHDEPLKGHRVGQRSIRLNRSWRLIYEMHEFENQTLITITILEINQHAY